MEDSTVHINNDTLLHVIINQCHIKLNANSVTNIFFAYERVHRRARSITIDPFYSPAQTVRHFVFEVTSKVRKCLHLLCISVIRLSVSMPFIIWSNSALHFRSHGKVLYSE